MASESLRPPVIWAQRTDILFITVNLEDCHNPEISLLEDKLIFKSKGGYEQKTYEFELEFHGKVVPEESKQLVTARNVVFKLKKLENGPYWPRLTKTKKPHFLKTDFALWKDEDDSDTENPEEDNFEAMMQQMGGMGGAGMGGMGGMGGAGGMGGFGMGDMSGMPDDDDKAADDSDDEDLPDLE